jgi:hypothetical protein
MILGRLLFLQQWGGATIVYFDKQKDLISVHHQKLLGAKTESFDIPLKDVVDVYVEQNSSVSLEEGCGGEKQVTTHYFYLVIKMSEGYSLPLTRSGDGKHYQFDFPVLQMKEWLSEKSRQWLGFVRLRLRRVKKRSKDCFENRRV